MAQLTNATHEATYKAGTAGLGMAKAMPLEQAQQTAIDKTLDFAEEMMVELGVHDLVKALEDLPNVVRDTQLLALSKKAEVNDCKDGPLAAAKERYDQTVLAAAMEAPSDGKNAEARKMQLDAFLSRCKPVQEAKSHLARAEADLGQLEYEAERQEALLDAARNQLRGALARAGLIESVIRATAIRS